jgi:hypothetical protein
MPRPWRDIMSYEDFKSIAKLKLVALTTADRAVKDVAEKVKLYHQISKTSASKIEARRSLLATVAESAEAWFVATGTNKAAAAYRPTSVTNTTGKGIDERNLSLPRIMLTLTRRSLRKREYLRQLTAYLNGAKSSAELIQYARTREERVDGQINMVVKMEAEDFAHREGYEGDGEIGQAFNAWADDPEATATPFFLWLEDHPICTSPNKRDLTVNGPKIVEYVGGNRKPSANSKMRILDFSSGSFVQEVDLTRDDATRQLCDTEIAGYRNLQKSIAPDNRGGIGVACFVWAPNNDVYIGQHESGRFHHSSFFAGGRVKCAGMMAVKTGFVTELSNDSGHYKPNPDEFRVFVRWLHSKNVVASNCYLSIIGSNDIYYRGPISNYARVGQGGLGQRLRA